MKRKEGILGEIGGCTVDRQMSSLDVVLGLRAGCRTLSISTVSVGRGALKGAAGVGVARVDSTQDG